MKKLFAVLAIVMILSGCASTSWFCQNKSTITSGLNAVVAAAEMLQLLGVPAEVAILCQQAVSLAQQGLNQACPDVAVLAAAQTKLAEAVGLAKAMGYRLGK